MKLRMVICIAMLFGSFSSIAADIPVNKKQWESLGSDEQQSIKNNLQRNRLLLEGDKIVPVDGAEAIGAWDPIKDLCKSACDVAAASAAASCSGSAAAIAACIAVVEAARQECRRRC